MAYKVTVYLEDVNGSFARLVRQAPTVARAYLSQAVASTTVSVKQRMSATVPVDEGDLKAAVDSKVPKRNALVGYAGVFIPEQAEVAMFNEYAPNKQKFMQPSAEAESNAFKKRCEDALKKLETAFSVS